MEVETQQVIHDDEEETVDPNRQCNNNGFLIVFNRFGWDLPSIVLSTYSREVTFYTVKISQWKSVIWQVTF